MKFLKTAMALLLACTILTGCGKKDLSEEEMKALFRDAQINMASVESSHMNMTARLNISGNILAESGLDHTVMTLTMDMKYKDMSKETMALSGNFGIDILGMNMTGNIYIKDEAMYIDLLGQKMKTPLDLSMMTLVQQPTTVDFSMLKNWTYQYKDHQSYIDCDIDATILETVMNILEDDLTSLKVNKLHCRYGISEDKYISSILIDLDLETTVEGESLACIGQIEMHWDDHNQITEIVYPDLSDYLETVDDLIDEDLLY